MANVKYQNVRSHGLLAYGTLICGNDTLHAQLCAPMQFVGASMCFKTFGANCSENNRVYALAMLGFASFDAQVCSAYPLLCTSEIMYDFIA
jgi:hypothetical protein